MSETGIGEELGELRIDRRMHQRAVVDRGHRLVVVGDIADHGFAALFVDVERKFVAVAVGGFGGDRREDALDRLQSGLGDEVAELGVLELGFVGIIDMAVTAPGAAHKGRALRLDPARRKSAEFDRFGAQEIGFHRGDFGDQDFARQRGVDEYHLTLVAGEAVAAEDAFFDFNFDSGSDFHKSPLLFKHSYHNIAVRRGKSEKNYKKSDFLRDIGSLAWYSISRPFISNQSRWRIS